MPPHAAELCRCLETCDVAGMRKLSAHVFPHLPQPKDDAAALAMIHHARTQTEMPLRLRAYSHRWLCDRGYPSGLPDALRPAAERMYPTITEGVGISVGTVSKLFQPIVPLIRGAMEHAVLDAYAERRTEPVFVKARMMEARQAAVKQLLGIG